MYYVPSGDNFGKNLTRLRKERGLTRLKLAALLEIPVTDLIDMEKGIQRKIPRELVLKICQILQTDMETLFRL